MFGSAFCPHSHCSGIRITVITLTTAGLGDYVPTTDANKIICSIFIYFGVACIGLLLGSYIASMLDDRAFRDAKRKQMNSCPNCARLMSVKDETGNVPSNGNKSATTVSPGSRPFLIKDPFHLSLRQINGPEMRNAVYTPRHHHNRSGHDDMNPEYGIGIGQKTGRISTVADSQVFEDVAPFAADDAIPPPPPSISTYNSSSPAGNKNILGSPMTRQILGRQKHTRHQSIDISNVTWNPTTRKYSADLPGPSLLTPPSISEDVELNPPLSAPNPVPQVPFSTEGPKGHSLRGSAYVNDNHCDSESDYDENDEYTEESSETASTIDDIVDERLSKIKAAKYVFLTLKQALVNSMVIIAVGCIGFMLTEEFTVVDSWYFVSSQLISFRLSQLPSHNFWCSQKTTVLLTTVGYGDIVPITNGGKLFATVYILVAGTVLINNMSMISMIPLELRRRRIEHAVLTQFGDQLDDAALRELATGPLIQRLSLSANRADGLDECTREMFSLAMLVRLGKVTEEDIRETFAVFRRLDVNDEGVLNSKSIIAGMIQKHRLIRSSSQPIKQPDGGGVSTVARNSSNTPHFLPHWQMPQIPFAATASSVYGTPIPFVPDGTATERLVLAKKEPNETTCLVQGGSNR